jgi:Fe-S cluster assembly protein SufD
MIETSERQDLYLAHFARIRKDTDGRPAWLQKLCRGAIDRFATLGFPTTHDEDWKYTNLSPLEKISFQPAGPARSKLTWRAIEQATLSGARFPSRLVFVNGRYSPGFSSLAEPAKGMVVTSLAEALAKGDETAENHLARYAQFDDRAMVALNTALFEDGALVVIPSGLILDEPVHLLFVSAPDDEPFVSHPRNLILAGKGSQASLIEEYISLGEGVHFTNTVTELVIGEGAVIDHYKLQSESEQAFHVSTVQGYQERSSTLTSHNVSLGGGLVRNDVNSVLDAEGAECVLNGLFVAGGSQHVDNHTWLDHAKPNCLSRELYKGILGGRASAVFNGKIMVRKDAQKTNALQSNKNLLLSEDAVINTKPQLEIYADDVRCTHGATVGQLDAEALFYMQSRGIGRAEARDLLTYAFAGELFDRMKVDGLRDRLEKALYRKLSPNRQEGSL